MKYYLVLTIAVLMPLTGCQTVEQQHTSVPVSSTLPGTVTLVLTPEHASAQTGQPTIPSPAQSPTLKPTQTPKPTSPLTPTPSQTAQKEITGTLVVVSYQADKINKQTYLPELSNLALINLDNGTVTPLTNGDYRDQQPRWSPDGQQIAFSSNRSGRFDIFTINRDGSNLTQVTRGEGDKVSPIWSLDGHQLAFVWAKPEQAKVEYSEISSIDLTTQKVIHHLGVSWTITEAQSIRNIDWSPVNKDLILYTKFEDVAVPGEGNFFADRVYLYNLQTRKSFLLTPEGWTSYNPRWSPDGSLVLMKGSTFTSDTEDFPMVGTLAQKTGAFALTGVRLLDGITYPLITVSWSPNGAMWVGTSPKEGGVTQLEIYRVQDYLAPTDAPPDPLSGVTEIGGDTGYLYEIDGKELGYDQPDWHW